MASSPQPQRASDDGSAQGKGFAFRCDLKAPEDPDRALEIALRAWGALPPYRAATERIRPLFCEVMHRLLRSNWDTLPEALREAIEFAVRDPDDTANARFALAWALAERPGECRPLPRQDSRAAQHLRNALLPGPDPDRSPTLNRTLVALALTLLVHMEAEDADCESVETDEEAVRLLQARLFPPSLTATNVARVLSVERDRFPPTAQGFLRASLGGEVLDIVVLGALLDGDDEASANIASVPKTCGDACSQRVKWAEILRLANEAAVGNPVAKEALRGLTADRIRKRAARNSPPWGPLHHDRSIGTVRRVVSSFRA